MELNEAEGLARWTAQSEAEPTPGQAERMTKALSMLVVALIDDLRDVPPHE